MIKRQLIAFSVGAAFPLIGVVTVAVAVAVKAVVAAATGHQHV